MEYGIQFRDVDSLGEADFRIRAVWCPYQYPAELDELRRWGVSEATIRKEILDKVEARHCHPYYSLPAGVVVEPRDLIYMAVEVEFAGVDQPKFGCLVLSDNEASCLQIFHEEEDFDFYGCPAEDDENELPLIRLLGRPLSGNVLVKVRPLMDLPGIVCPDEFEIPVTCAEDR